MCTLRSTKIGSRDITAEFRRGKNLEVGELLTGLTRAQFELSAFVPQGQIVWDDASSLAEALQRAADSQSGENTAAAAIEVLESSLDQYVGLTLKKGKAETEIQRCEEGAAKAGAALAALDERRSALDTEIDQLRRLKSEAIPFSVTPGVPSFAAAAASLGAELTLPGVAQSVVLTRTPGRASSMPDGESLTNFAATGATLAIHLSIGNVSQVVADLLPAYGAECPVAVVYRASWPDERILHATLATLESTLDPDISRTALILVGPVLAAEGFTESCLYAPDYDRRYRPQTADSTWANWSHGDD